MDENKPKKSPWGQLAQDLGAEPSSEAFQRSQPPAVEIPATEATDQENDPETPPQSPSDWNALAGSLGLEVPEPPPKPSEPENTAQPAVEPLVETEAISAEEVAISSESPSKDESFGTGVSREAGFSEEDSDEDNDEENDEDSADPLPPLPSEVDQIMSEGDWDSEEDTDEDLANENEDETGMSGNAAKNAFDALFNADGSALAIPSPEWVREKPLESAEGVVDQVAPEARANDSEDSNQENDDSEDDEKEQRPKRKRSRRRRGRGRGRKTEAEQTPTEETPTNETADGQDALNGEDQGDAEDKEASDDDEKPRRRRPRRRSRRTASADSPTGTGDSKETDDSMEPLSYGDNELAEGSGSSHRDSTGHRNMPTWTEALSTIIEGNLELHSKAPSRQGSSRGRGRGGRGRKKS